MAAGKKATVEFKRCFSTQPTLADIRRDSRSNRCSPTAKGDPDIDLAGLTPSESNIHHLAASPCNSTFVPSALSNFTLLSSKASVHLRVSPVPPIRRSTTKVWSSSQVPLTASTP